MNDEDLYFTVVETTVIGGSFSIHPVYSVVRDETYDLLYQRNACQDHMTRFPILVDGKGIVDFQSRTVALCKFSPGSLS